VLCKGVFCVHFHSKDILLHSSFATAKTVSLRFVQGFLSVEAKLPFAISRMQCWDQTRHWPLAAEKEEEEEGAKVGQSSRGWSLGSQTAAALRTLLLFNPRASWAVHPLTFQM